MIAAIKAPLAVVESFVVVSVLLFFVAMRLACHRRAVSVAVVTFLCLAAENYAVYQAANGLGVDEGKSTAGRSLVAELMLLILAMAVVLVVGAATASTIVTYVLHVHLARQPALKAEIEGLPEPGETPSGPVDPKSSSLPPNGSVAKSGIAAAASLSAQNEIRQRQPRPRQRSTTLPAEDTGRAKRIRRRLGLFFIDLTVLLGLIPSTSEAAFYFSRWVSPTNRGNPA